MRDFGRKAKRLAIFLIVAGTFLTALSVGSDAQGGPPPGTLVRIDGVQSGTINVHRVFLGSMHASRTSTVSCETNGALSELKFDVGAMVRANEVIAILRNDTHSQMLSAARAERVRLNASVTELRALADEDKSLAQAELQKAAADRDFWKNEVVRVTGLRQSDDATEQQLSEATRQLAVAEAEVLAKQASLRQYDDRAGSRAAQIAGVEASLTAQDATISRLQTEVDRLTIRAPFSGYVSQKHSEVGEWMMAGSPLLTVIALDPIEARIDVPEEVLPFINNGDSVEVQINAIKRMNRFGKPVHFMGKVKAIAPAGDSRRRSFSVRVDVSNNEQAWQQAIALSESARLSELSAEGQPAPEAAPLMHSLLRAGMSVSVSLPASPASEGLLVSKDAIVMVGGTTPAVFVVIDAPDGSGKMGAMRPVQLGGVRGDMQEISGPVQLTDKVIVRGNERLAPPQAAIRIEKDLSEKAAPAPGADQ